MFLMDDNRDGKFFVDEIKKYKDIFISSKIVNVKKVLYDEFQNKKLYISDIFVYNCNNFFNIQLDIYMYILNIN